MRVYKTLIIAALTVPAMALMPGHIAAQQVSDPPPAPPASPIEAAPPPPLPGGPVEVVAGNGEMKLRLNFQDAPLQTVGRKIEFQ